MQTFTNASEVDVNKIKKSDLDNIARYLLKVAERLMADPTMQKKYEKWKKERRANAQREEKGMIYYEM